MGCRSGERRRLSSYAVTFGGGTAFGFLAFASYANRLPVCDALSPVWLSDALLGSALLLGLSMVEAKDWKLRFVLALGAGSSLLLSMPSCGRTA
ncbi:hypothetical protein H9L15_06400 [Sphingomonas daechungensis]|uniref:Uncharacterized protein n=1 Tax=Sphingomonas daechungensis TaxID=1176646 RepID=A0ABX6T2X7_9SPHN|nr:hypothetical protein [Sphingomonas daechungensis]QNP44149.1 hypothetical protein H9L15_06400 [Sphingomonas daechungensis]